MPRCIVCDFSSDIEPKRNKKVTWSKQHNGYICNTCRSDIQDANYTFSNKDIPERILLEGLEFLEIAYLDDYQNEARIDGKKSTPSEEEPDLPPFD